MTAAPTESKKVKGHLITQIKAPSKPSRSPFLSGKEKQALSSLLAPLWNTPEQMRDIWVSLSAKEQHSEYSDYVKALKQHFEHINKVSTSIHAKLGHRKKWIHAACEERGVAPTSKKDKANEFAWTSNFFKMNNTEINLPVSLVFAPNHYLTDPKYAADDILFKLWLRAPKDGFLASDDCTEEICGVSVELWKEWANRFHPDPAMSLVDVPKAETLGDTNPYAELDEAEA
jgi:hypothetical protein